MNFLQLCQRGILECGVAGALSSAAISATGSQGRIVTWINQAWNEIQTRQDEWEWMRSSNLLGLGASFTTVAGQASYPLGTGAGTSGVLSTNFGKWDRYSFRNYTTTVGVSNEMIMDWIPYDTWRDSYMLGAMRTVQTRPVAIAIGPDKSLCLGPPPNALYTITGDYWVAPTLMSADVDVPTGLPAQFHMAIVYRAMEMYGGYESAPEVLQRGSKGFADLIRQLEAIYGPGIALAGALA